MEKLTLVCLGVVLAPLIGAVVAGLGGRVVGRVGAHSVTILGIAVSFALSCYAFWLLLAAKAAGGDYVLDVDLYTWLQSGPLTVSIGLALYRPGPGVEDPRILGEALIADADLALYRAKAEGRNKVALAADRL